MKKDTKANKATPDKSAWDIGEEVTRAIPEATEEFVDEFVDTFKETKSRAQPKAKIEDTGFDLEGLMNDFPTAKELEKFVFDQTGIVLELKGRSNKFKYQTALDVLNGAEPPSELIGSENPYLDKNELIPTDPLRTDFPKPKEIEGETLVTQFHTKSFPHPDPDWKAQGQHCDVVFRKYTNNVITYEILGPIAPKAVGMRINKYGKEQPERYTWIDPRTGEQVIRDGFNRLTPIGTRLRNHMKKISVNKSNAWDTWVDREFVVVDDNYTDNPWSDV